MRGTLTSRRHIALIAGIALLLPVAGALALNGNGVSAAATTISFGRMVVVDEQRPGFEPDVKIAADGTTYTSFPFGFSTTQSFLSSSRDGGKSYQFTPGNIGAGKPATCAGGGD